MFSILFALKGSFYMQVIYRGLDVVFICGIFKFNIFFGWCDTLHQSWLVRSLFQGLVFGSIHALYSNYKLIAAPHLLKHLTCIKTSCDATTRLLQHLLYSSPTLR